MSPGESDGIDSPNWLLAPTRRRDLEPIPEASGYGGKARTGDREGVGLPAAALPAVPF